MERLRGCHAPAGSQLGTPEELALTWDHYLWRRYDNDVGVTRLKYRLCRSGIGRVAAAWVALRHAGDWRWMTRREDSPRYPTLRLFRQERPGEWDPVFEKMAAGLCAFPASP